MIFLELTLFLPAEKSRITWSFEAKTAIFRHAVEHRYTAKLLPDVQVLLSLCHTLRVPVHHGKRVTASCLKKVLSAIVSTVNPQQTQGLIEHKCVGKLGSNDLYDIHFASCLRTIVRDIDFSFGLLKDSRYVAEQRQASGAAFEVVATSRPVGSLTLLHKRATAALIGAPPSGIFALPPQTFQLPVVAAPQAHPLPATTPLATTLPATASLKTTLPATTLPIIPPQTPLPATISNTGHAGMYKLNRKAFNYYLAAQIDYMQRLRESCVPASAARFHLSQQFPHGSKFNENVSYLAWFVLHHVRTTSMS